ncbi:hypothetical protein D3C73_1051980 [compost metagenome]
MAMLQQSKQQPALAPLELAVTHRCCQADIAVRPGRSQPQHISCRLEIPPQPRKVRLVVLKQRSSHEGSVLLERNIGRQNALQLLRVQRFDYSVNVLLIRCRDRAVGLNELRDHDAECLFASQPNDLQLHLILQRYPLCLPLYRHI